jgi:Rad52/22 family double-strand break repair protein
MAVAEPEKISAVIAAERSKLLNQPLDPSRVKKREGRGGGMFSYLEAHDVKRTMNTLFGFDGWGYTIVAQEEFAAVEVEKGDRRGWHVGWRCVVRLHVVGFPDTDGSGYGDGTEYGPTSRVTACELAIKESESDALKRACTKLGDQLGLGLYEKDGGAARQAAETERRQEGARQDPVPDSWEGKNGIRTRLEGSADGPQDVWGLFMAFTKAAMIDRWGKEQTKDLTKEQRDVLFQKAATVCVDLVENTPTEGAGFTFYTEERMRAAWAKVVDGHMLTIPDYVPPEPEPAGGYDEEAEMLADATVVGPEK